MIPNMSHLLLVVSFAAMPHLSGSRRTYVCNNSIDKLRDTVIAHVGFYIREIFRAITVSLRLKEPLGRRCAAGPAYILYVAHSYVRRILRSVAVDQFNGSRSLRRHFWL